MEIDVNAPIKNAALRDAAIAATATAEEAQVEFIELLNVLNNLNAHRALATLYHALRLGAFDGKYPLALLDEASDAHITIERCGCIYGTVAPLAPRIRERGSRMVSDKDVFEQLLVQATRDAYATAGAQERAGQAVRWSDSYGLSPAYYIALYSPLERWIWQVRPGMTAATNDRLALLQQWFTTWMTDHHYWLSDVSVALAVDDDDDWDWDDEDGEDDEDDEDDEEDLEDGEGE